MNCPRLFRNFFFLYFIFFLFFNLLEQLQQLQLNLHYSYKIKKRVRKQSMEYVSTRYNLHITRYYTTTKLKVCYLQRKKRTLTNSFRLH